MDSISDNLQARKMKIFRVPIAGTKSLLLFDEQALAEMKMIKIASNDDTQISNIVAADVLTKILCLPQREKSSVRAIILDFEKRAAIILFSFPDEALNLYNSTCMSLFLRVLRVSSLSASSLLTSSCFSLRLKEGQRSSNSACKGEYVFR